MSGYQLQQEVTEIMNSYERLFVQRAYAITRDIEDARDIVQDAFIKYLKYRSRGTNIDNPKNWFYMVIRNSSIDLLRKRSKKEISDSQSKEAELTLTTTATTARSPFRELEHSEDLELTANLLKELTEREMNIVKMKILQNLSYKEIAENHSISVSNVGVTLCNALKKLRRKACEQNFT